MGKAWSNEETAPFVTGWRPAVVTHWYDADTPKLDIDLGFGVKQHGYVRLISENALLTTDTKDDIVDAWEIRGPERDRGKAAKARAMELVPEGSKIRIWSYKGDGQRGKYGRYLVILLYFNANAWRSLGDVLIEEGHAERNL